MQNRPTVFLAVLSALLSCAGVALAQTDGNIAARRVFLEQAQQARTSGNHSQALELAERGGRIQMSPSLRMFIAEEHQAMGHAGEAYGGAELCVREAERDTTLNNRDAILSTCRGIVDSFRGRIAVLTVRIPTPTPAGLVVRVGGTTLPAASYNGPYVVSAGTVSVDAIATAQPAFHRDVTLAPGASQDVSVELQPGAPPGASTGGIPPGESRPRPRAGVPVGGIVVAGVGVAVLAAGIAFFGARQGAIGSCRIEPNRIVCPSTEDQTRAMGAYTMNTLTNVFVPAGAAVIAGGLAWIVIGLATSGGGRADTPPRATLEIAPVPGGMTFGIGGRL